jgi:hypothetical protein
LVYLIGVNGVNERSREPQPHPPEGVTLTVALARGVGGSVLVSGGGKYVKV